jgi:hypothetical protein
LSPYTRAKPLLTTVFECDGVHVGLAWATFTIAGDASSAVKEAEVSATAKRALITVSTLSERVLGPM